MELSDYLRRQFVYDAWANREVLTAMRASGVAGPQSLRLLAHILSAERLWLERLQMRSQSLPVWPDFDLDQCEAQADDLKRLWSEYFRTMTSLMLSAPVSYRNSKGEA